jgi:hypothetical protein
MIAAWTITMHASPMQRDTAKVKWQYENLRTGALETIGHLHLSYDRLEALIRMLRVGGARLAFSGPFFVQHPRFTRLGTSNE